MKKAVYSILAIVLITIGLTSCNSNTPKASADKFLTGLLHYDYESAKSVSTEETKKMVDLMAQFSSMMPDSVKQDAKKVKIIIKDSKEEGDKAVVTYSTSDDTTQKKINLVKQNDKWLVQYSKMDNPMGDQNANDMNAGEEPATDSTANMSTEAADTTK